MRLISVYDEPSGAEFLWRLLKERKPEESISHKGMPAYAEHEAFVASVPYKAWYLIDCGDFVGATYLSFSNEIGVAILKPFRGNKYALNAIRMLMERHPGPYLANIAPGNHASAALFTRLGFKMIQHTYALETT
jgi:RimJ/RimL family protein N-acetyltransferase